MAGDHFLDVKVIAVLASIWVGWVPVVRYTAAVGPQIHLSALCPRCLFAVRVLVHVVFGEAAFAWDMHIGVSSEE